MASCGPGGKKGNVNCETFSGENSKSHPLLKKIKQVTKNFGYTKTKTKAVVKPDLGNQSHINPRQMK